jgi:hypothetical protein
MTQQPMHVGLPLSATFPTVQEQMLEEFYWWMCARVQGRLMKWGEHEGVVGKDSEGSVIEHLPTLRILEQQQATGIGSLSLSLLQAQELADVVDCSLTKQRVFTKTREVLGLLTHHPLESKIAKELFHSMAVSVFRFSAAQVRWSKAELDQLRSLWVQAYKRAENLHKGTASDIFIFPEKRGGEELSTPTNIIAQELCNNIRRSLVHDDVAKSITVMELQRTKEEWMCHTLHELYDEMELWGWDEVQHNRWARALKASNQVNVRPMWYIEDTEHE